MEYRKEIDGLRAIAVLAVVLYHAEFFFSGGLIATGGYLGVDIFFVISGFLISRILITEISDKSFSYLEFYNRRARRILPAVLVTMVATSMFFYFVLLPGPLIELAQSTIAASLFSSNIFFWMSDSYIAEPSKYKPVLHTWSLSVEEQFYFVLPVILMPILAFFKKYLQPILIFICIASLVFAQFYWDLDSDGVFYLLPFRAWELLVGSLLAIHVSKRREIIDRLGVKSDIIAIVGLVLILVPIILYDDTMQHPSVLTIPPVLGCALLIFFARQGATLTKILSLKPIRAIGLISYSWYLWHWPVLVYMRLTVNNFDNWDRAVFVGIGLLLAIGSYYLIERPFRSKKTSPWITYPFLLVGFSGLIAWSVYVINQNGLPDRFNQVVQVRYKPVEKYGELDQCHFNEKSLRPKPEFLASDPFESCPDKVQDGPRNIFIIGDSHAANLQLVIRQEYSEENIVQRTGANCPMIKGDFPSKSAGCDHIIEALYKELENTPPSTIIWGNYWLKYRLFQNEKLQETFLSSLDEVRSYGHKIILIGQFPIYQRHVPVIVKDLMEQGEDEVPNGIGVNQGLAEWFFHREGLFTKFISEQNSLFVRPVDTFCDVETERCRPIFKDKINVFMTSYDYGHLTPPAAKVLIADPKFVEAMQER